MKKIVPALMIALSATFMLSACKEDGGGILGGNTQEKMPFGWPIPKTVSQDIIDAVSKAPAPERTYKTEHPVKDDYFLQMTFNVKTQDNRELSVSAQAYCETYDDLPFDTYAGKCGQYIKLELEFHAQEYGCFEGAIPAVNAEVRNHPALAEHHGKLCSAHYPDDMGGFTPAMMRTALELTGFDQNLYTVNHIAPQ